VLLTEPISKIFNFPGQLTQNGAKRKAAAEKQQQQQIMMNAARFDPNKFVNLSFA